MTALGKALDQVAVRVEHIDKAMTLARHVVMFRGVLQGIGHEQDTTDIMNPKRGITRWDIRIGEGPITQAYSLISGRARGKNFDGRRPEVCREQQRSTTTVRGKGETLEDGSPR